MMEIGTFSLSNVDT
ncbi:hypothetical protein YPPY103_2767, partial [Yersinia pestis PY-103]